MARRDNTAVVEDVDLSTETEEVAAPTESSEKAPKAKKEKARGDLPDGFVTPVGLATELTKRELHTTKAGSHEVKPQMVYSYIKNAPKDDPFPTQTIQDSLGKDRQVVAVEEGVAWWERKNARVTEKRTNAQAKKDKKAENAAKKAAAATEAEGDSGEATEAE